MERQPRTIESAGRHAGRREKLSRPLVGGAFPPLAGSAYGATGPAMSSETVHIPHQKEEDRPVEAKEVRTERSLGSASYPPKGSLLYNLSYRHMLVLLNQGNSRKGQTFGSGIFLKAANPIYPGAFSFSTFLCRF